MQYVTNFDEFMNEAEGRDTLAELNEMTLGQLERISDYANMIKDRMTNGEQLESWMYSQLTIALENLNAVHDAMDGNDGVEEANKPGPDPYMTGLSDETEEEKEEKMKKQAEMDDDDDSAYKELPGDKEAREKGQVKTSKHTKSYHELYGESTVNEDVDSLLLGAILVVQAAILGGNIGVLAARYGDNTLGPIDSIKKWWKERKDDKAIKSIIAKIEKDPEMIEFFKLSQSQQRGKFRKLIATKLSGDEIQYLNRINKGDLIQVESMEIDEAKEQSTDRSAIDDDAIETGLKTKSEETGVPIGILRAVMRRGLAAWKSGHRPGANQQQWGYARVNSFLTKQSGTWGGADKDLAKEVRDGGYDKDLK